MNPRRFLRTVPVKVVVLRAVALGFAAAALIGAGCSRHHHPPELAEVYGAPYTRPFVSPGARFTTLPPAVQNTIRAQAGSAEISDIVKFTNNTGQINYKVWFSKALEMPPLYIASDGSVLAPDLSVEMGAPQDSITLITGGPVTGISLSDLPPQVIKVIHARAPTSEVDYIDREGQGNNVIYDITFKDRRHYPRLRVAADGTVLEPR